MQDKVQNIDQSISRSIYLSWGPVQKEFPITLHNIWTGGSPLKSTAVLEF